MGSGNRVISVMGHHLWNTIFTIISLALNRGSVTHQPKTFLFVRFVQAFVPSGSHLLDSVSAIRFDVLTVRLDSTSRYLAKDNSRAFCSFSFWLFAYLSAFLALLLTVIFSEAESHLTEVRA